MAKSTKRRRSQSRQKGQLPLPLIVALGGVLLLGLGLLATWRGNTPAGTAGENGQPNLVVDQEVVDFGDVRLGQWVTASFTLANTGDGPVRFTEPPYIEVVAGCWPPKPAVGATVIKPGEKTTLTMSFMMHGDMGGPHDFRVHLPTNDQRWAGRTLTVLSNWVE